MDPKRLLELEAGDSASALERELLSSLKPPEEARERVWQRLAAPGALVAGASAAGLTAANASASTGAAASSSASAFSVAKLGLVLAVAVPAAGGAVYLTSAQPPAPAAAQAAPVTTAAPARASQAPRTQAAPSAEASSAPEPSAERAPARSMAPELSAISEENRLLREARAASRAGDPAAALATLRLLDRRFPGGSLVQERELLRVQALRAQGLHAEAEQRARRFLKLYPSSPYASHMKASLEAGTP